VVEPANPLTYQRRVFQINISDGGVPKRAVQAARVTTLGLVGDRQPDIETHSGLLVGMPARLG
jgi:hypothetical protein